MVWQNGYLKIFYAVIDNQNNRILESPQHLLLILYASVGMGQGREWVSHVYFIGVEGQVSQMMQPS